MLKHLTIILLLRLLSFPTPAHAQDNTALYTVTFESTWSQQTHPHPGGAAQFPSNAHFSPLIGAMHNLSATFWMSGTLASPGIERMAETGGTATLRAEFAAAGANVNAILAGAGIASPGAIILPAFTVQRTHPLVTLVTMIAPSPDWFVGVHGLSLLDAQGEWQDSVVVTLYPYDAGSDDGADYASADIEPAAHQPVANLRGQAPFSDAPIGTFTFTRLYQLHLPLTANG